VRPTPDLEQRGWIGAKWGASANNRKARFYTLTRAGRKQLGKETAKRRRLAAAIRLVLGPEARKSQARVARTCSEK